MSRRNRGNVHNGGQNEVQTLLCYRFLLQRQTRREINPRPTLYHRHHKLRTNANRTNDGRPYVVRRHRELRTNAIGRPMVAPTTWSAPSIPVGACIARPCYNVTLRITFCNRITSYLPHRKLRINTNFIQKCPKNAQKLRVNKKLTILFCTYKKA